MSDSGVDGVFGDIALDPEIVVDPAILGFSFCWGRENTALYLHLVRGLPGAGNHFADPAHGLRIGRNHRERTQVVQDVLGGDGFAADARIGEGHVPGNTGIEVMADHQHVEVFVHGVDRVRPGRIGGGGQHVRLTAGADDVGRMAPPAPSV